MIDNVVLNADQKRALAEIICAMDNGVDFHLLTGYAGSGKTTLMQKFSEHCLENDMKIVLSAPTHKATSVIRQKVSAAGINAPCMTLHRLLQLRPEYEKDRKLFKRSPDAKPIKADVVVIDECSMLGADLMEQINLYFPNTFVLFVGDPAQLPPIGEAISTSFKTESRSHLDTIVRQGAGNPILDAADIIRKSQGNPMDWSWKCSAKVPPIGVYMLQNGNKSIKEVFLRDEFDENPYLCRYLCYTNERVRQFNKSIRLLKYGKTPSPFVAGEQILLRAPVMNANGTPIIMTNDEATVVKVEDAIFSYEIPEREKSPKWSVEFPAWRMTIRTLSGKIAEVYHPKTRNPKELSNADKRLRLEAKKIKARWGDWHRLHDKLPRMQSVYAMTVHVSQGSTYDNVFVDVGDISRIAGKNVLLAQQLFYVAITRPTSAVMLVNK